MTSNRKKHYRIDVIVESDEDETDEMAEAVEAALVNIGLPPTTEVVPYEVTWFD
ncbi:hypothetical protein SEA_CHARGERPOWER_59 [Mycobacterium phage Chargerpower]|nr:hypothetical protein SEA_CHARGERPOWER_59 [Mycobacterium phage Chargerpower]